MKKTICLVMLVISITGAAFAQSNSNANDKTFDLPPGHASMRFDVDLGKGNKLQISLSDIEDLKRFANMDSVIRVFLADMEILKDSLGDELLSRRVDYNTDSAGRKKIRIQQFQPRGSSFLLEEGDLAALKLDQDTINITGTVSFIAKHTLRKAFTAYRHYQLSFFLNDLSDLREYTEGSISRKIKNLQESRNSSWKSSGKGTEYLMAEPSVSAKLPKGFVAGGDFLIFRLSVDAQNYKHYFVPSFSLGLGVIVSNSRIKRDIVLSWDPNFFFGRNSGGSLKTLRNDFLTLTWGQGRLNHEPRKESELLFTMSLGYLVKREGDYFEKNTFRMGAGRLSLFAGKTKIEPALYFNNFFKGVTPGLRLIQNF